MTGAQESPNGAQWLAPFGERASTVNGFNLDAPTRFGWNSSLTHHGFTGHKEIDESSVVHMNGRIYDPVQIRFEQADPFIQNANDLQAYNR